MGSYDGRCRPTRFFPMALAGAATLEPAGRPGQSEKAIHTALSALEAPRMTELAAPNVTHSQALAHSSAHREYDIC